MTEERETDTTNLAPLYLKMAAVMGHLERLPKRGTNKHFGYAYVTDSDVLDAVRQAMAKEHVAFFVSMGATATTQKGSSVLLSITFADGDTGAAKTIKWEGEAHDSQDKGINKAVTAGVKYCLLKTFLMSTEDSDDDPDSGGPGEGTGPKAPTSQGSQVSVDPKTFKLRFGKHKGKTVAEIGDNPADAGYLGWALDNLDDDERNADLFAAIKAYLGMATGTEPEREPPAEYEQPTGDLFLNGDPGHAADAAEAQREIADLEPSPHWINNEAVRARFWAWTGGTLKLDGEQVHQALGVEHVSEYAGTMADAKTTILNWNAARKEAETA